MTAAMNARDRLLATLRYDPADRAPYRSWGGWPETIERWKAEGYDPENPPRFGEDRWAIHNWFLPNPPFEHQAIEEDDETILYVNHEGILMRELKENRMSSIPQFVRFPVETREDFRASWKERMQPDLTARIGPDWWWPSSMRMGTNTGSSPSAMPCRLLRPPTTNTRLDRPIRRACHRVFAAMRCCATRSSACGTTTSRSTAPPRSGDNSVVKGGK